MTKKTLKKKVMKKKVQAKPAVADFAAPVVESAREIWLAGLVFLGTCMPAYIRAYAEHNGLLTHEKAKAMGGIFERSERLILIALGLAAGLYFSMDYFVLAIILATMLSGLTVLQRVWYVLINKEE